VGAEVDVRGAAVWREDKMGKATLFQGEQLMLGLNAFEPGQFHAVHSHEGQDKAYYVVEGRGRFQLGDQQVELLAGQALVAAAGVPHGVTNESDKRLLVLVAMAPPPGAKPGQGSSSS
jgi:quercetin dioxygenase-like cupin family protein